jgi:hypothetical protein
MLNTNLVDSAAHSSGWRTGDTGIAGTTLSYYDDDGAEFGAGESQGLEMTVGRFIEHPEEYVTPAPETLQSIPWMRFPGNEKEMYKAANYRSPKGQLSPGLVRQIQTATGWAFTGVIERGPAENPHGWKLKVVAPRSNDICGPNLLSLIKTGGVGSGKCGCVMGKQCVLSHINPLCPEAYPNDLKEILMQPADAVERAFEEVKFGNLDDMQQAQMKRMKAEIEGGRARSSECKDDMNLEQTLEALKRRNWVKFTGNRIGSGLTMDATHIFFMEAVHKFDAKGSKQPMVRVSLDEMATRIRQIRTATAFGTEGTKSDFQ